MINPNKIELNNKTVKKFLNELLKPETKDAETVLECLILKEEFINVLLDLILDNELRADSVMLVGTILKRFIVTMFDNDASYSETLKLKFKNNIKEFLLHHNENKIGFVYEHIFAYLSNLETDKTDDFFDFIKTNLEPRTKTVLVILREYLELDNLNVESISTLALKLLQIIIQNFRSTYHTHIEEYISVMNRLIQTSDNCSAETSFKTTLTKEIFDLIQNEICSILNSDLRQRMDAVSVMIEFLRTILESEQLICEPKTLLLIISTMDTMQEHYNITDTSNVNTLYEQAVEKIVINSIKILKHCSLYVNSETAFTIIKHLVFYSSLREKDFNRGIDEWLTLINKDDAIEENARNCSCDAFVQLAEKNNTIDFINILNDYIQSSKPQQIEAFIMLLNCLHLKNKEVQNAIILLSTIPYNDITIIVQTLMFVTNNQATINKKFVDDSFTLLLEGLKSTNPFLNACSLICLKRLYENELDVDKVEASQDLIILETIRITSYSQSESIFEIIELWSKVYKAKTIPRTELTKMILNRLLEIWEANYNDPLLTSIINDFLATIFCLNTQVGQLIERSVLFPVINYLLETNFEKHEPEKMSSAYEIINTIAKSHISQCFLEHIIKLLDKHSVLSSWSLSPVDHVMNILKHVLIKNDQFIHNGLNVEKLMDLTYTLVMRAIPSFEEKDTCAVLCDVCILYIEKFINLTMLHRIQPLTLALIEKDTFLKEEYSKAKVLAINMYLCKQNFEATIDFFVKRNYLERFIESIIALHDTFHGNYLKLSIYTLGEIVKNTNMNGLDLSVEDELENKDTERILTRSQSRKKNKIRINYKTRLMKMLINEYISEVENATSHIIKLDQAIDANNSDDWADIEPTPFVSDYSIINTDLINDNSNIYSDESVVLQEFDQLDIKLYLFGVFKTVFMDNNANSFWLNQLPIELVTKINAYISFN